MRAMLLSALIGCAENAERTEVIDTSAPTTGTDDTGDPASSPTAPDVCAQVACIEVTCDEVLCPGADERIEEAWSDEIEAVTCSWACTDYDGMSGIGLEITWTRRVSIGCWDVFGTDVDSEGLCY